MVNTVLIVYTFICVAIKIAVSLNCCTTECPYGDDLQLTIIAVGCTVFA